MIFALCRPSGKPASAVGSIVSVRPSTHPALIAFAKRNGAAPGAAPSYCLMKRRSALGGLGHLGCEILFLLLDAFAHFHANEACDRRARFLGSRFDREVGVDDEGLAEERVLGHELLHAADDHLLDDLLGLAAFARD